MTKVTIVIPAAGASRRMLGRDKLLEQVDGMALLRGVAMRACALGGPVIVTLPDGAVARSEALAGLDVQHVSVPEAANGMSASLRRAAHGVAKDANGLMVLPADMPDLTEDDLRHVLMAYETAESEAIVQATSADGTPGHPVLFPADLIPTFEGLTGDAGARAILAANRRRLIRVALPAAHATTDLDTPDAWAIWRENNPAR
ncbi:nucleotidyltransferase family protein [Marivita sp.]|uniref:nucleotidyltransferase family protein n=1 Tax=Marivita sp. TaxID=2003365 RepID=UPI0025BCB915|nr:nucleotidyltransferase family protein [Marivita sp.]